MTEKAATRQASTLREALKGGDSHPYVMGRVRRFLDEVREGERAPVARLHPLGFLCLPMHRSEEFGFCVHAWLPGARRETSPTSDMHLHTFDMYSRILHGSVVNHTLELDPESEPTHRIFEITKGASEDVDLFRETGEDTTPRFVRDDAFSAGDQYDIRRGQYHSAAETLDLDFTVTLMLAENWNDDPQRTLVELGQVSSIPREYHRVRLTGAEAQSSALDVLNLLS